MADIELVINIDEDTYRYMQARCKFQNKGDKGLSKFEEAGVAIRNGTPLPKGHGRLIDADAFSGNMFCDADLTNQHTCYDSICKLLDDAKTIIEADKAERGNKE